MGSIAATTAAAVRALGESVKEGVVQTEEVNNHVYSNYSFSPYSPTMIGVKAAQAAEIDRLDHLFASEFEEPFADFTV